MNFDKKFFQSVAVLFSGSLISQLIAIIASPILTRIFDSSALGTYTYLISTVSVFSPIINLRFDMSIVTSNDEKDIPNIIKGSLAVGILMTVFSSFIYLLIIMISNGTETLLSTVPYFFILLISFSIINVLTSYNNRNQNYKIISEVTILRSFFQNIGSICLGFFYSASSVLLFCYTFGQFAGIRKQGKQIKNWKKIMGIPIREYFPVLKKEFRQPLYSTPAIFFNGLSYALITIMIENLYGLSEVGYYSISVRMLGIPLALISGNVSKIFFEKASKDYNSEKNFSKVFSQVFLLQLSIAIPMTIFLMTFSPSLFKIFFGIDWQIAGHYVVILAPMFGVRFIVSTLSPALIITNKQRTDFLLQILFVVSIIAIFIYSKINLIDIDIFLMLISIFFTIVYLIYLLYIYLYSKGEKNYD